MLSGAGQADLSISEIGEPVLTVALNLFLADRSETLCGGVRYEKIFPPFWYL